MGHLIRARPGAQTFTTRNAIEEKWKYAATVYSSTRNAILTNTTLSFNTVTGVAQHAFDPPSAATHLRAAASRANTFIYLDHLTPNARPPRNHYCPTRRYLDITSVAGTYSKYHDWTSHSPPCTRARITSTVATNNTPRCAVQKPTLSLA